jgi:hypothetical protein
VTDQNRKSSGRAYALALFACLLVSFACLAYPVYVIRPFRAQGHTELLVALAVTRFRPAITTGCAAAALAALVWYWRRERRKLRRIAAVIGTIAVAGLSVLTRVNVYELMFHPMGRPAFVRASEAKLDPDDMVIAVTFGRTSRAYPIRVLAYHHVANDTLGGVPIAATY